MDARYSSETDRILSRIILKEPESSFRFALLTDSRLCDEVPSVCESIAAIDSTVPFDCIVHLGNVVLGNNPEGISAQLCQSEVQLFRESVKSRRLYLTQGKTDGYRDERFIGQLAMNIISDEKWARQTAFLREDKRVTCPADKPYYHADFPEKRVRLICLCSYYSLLDEEAGFYKKYTTIDVAQSRWLKEILENTESGWTVLLFSHAIPESRFETGKDPFIYQGFSTEPTLQLLQMAVRRGVNVAGWFAGAYQRDEIIQVGGISHISLHSLSPSSEKFVTEDEISESWDIVTVHTESREVEFLRFGYGENRKLSY